MPKEVLHWVIARMVGEGLPPGRVRKAVEAHPGLFFYGAVAPDSLFYVLSPSREVREAGRRVHGTAGVESFAGLRRVVEGGAGEVADALVAGWLTHVAADVVFHPMVFYLTGSREAEDERVRKGSTYRHYALETVLDLYVLDRWEVPWGGRLERMVGPYGGDRRVGEVLGAAWFLDEGRADEAGRVMRRHALLQGLFFSKGAAFLVDAAGVVVPWLRSFRGLFYRERFRWLRGVWRGPVAWRHPVTGEEREAGVEELMEEAVEKGRELVRMLEEVPAREWPVGPCLETGLPVDDTRPMRYFDVEREPVCSIWS